MYSPLPNAEQIDVGGESKGGSTDSDYAEDNEDSKDDLEESEEKIQSPPRDEPRSKHRHDGQLLQARP